MQWLQPQSLQTSSERAGKQTLHVLVSDCRLLSENASFGLEELFHIDISVKTWQSAVSYSPHSCLAERIEGTADSSWL